MPAMKDGCVLRYVHACNRLGDFDSGLLFHLVKIVRCPN